MDMAFAVQIAAAVAAVVGTAALGLMLTERTALVNLAIGAVGTMLVVSVLPGHGDTTIMGLLLLGLMVAIRAGVRALAYRSGGRSQRIARPGV
ncbi:MAG TPA: hypothetical protein VHF25_02395 [Nitriliruptorales bacterium]|nr:hypothetical protein [Nitriliruptorales bacterium]